MDSLATLIEDARRALGRPDLLVSIDHEGGRVHRLPPPVTKFPAARHWQESGREVAIAMAHELRALGITLTYAPVLDVFAEAQNTVIGPRAFEGSAESVAQRAVEFIDGLREGGILCCGKHFPGHGATVSDSHFELPYLDATRSLLNSRELVPFVAAIRAAVPLIMTAHVVYRALDGENPATLSSAILDGLLRKELGFTGAVITDDLEMHALADIGPEQIAIRALNAGVDILLEANPKATPAVEVGVKMAAGLRVAVERGLLDPARVILSRERIAKVRAIHSVLTGQNVEHSAIGSPEHQLLAARLTPAINA